LPGPAASIQISPKKFEWRYTDRADCKWSATTVIRILRDETYTGMLVQGKRGTSNYKIKDLTMRTVYSS
jgi:hypothetical protein